MLATRADRLRIFAAILEARILCCFVLLSIHQQRFTIRYRHDLRAPQPFCKSGTDVIFQLLRYSNVFVFDPLSLVGSSDFALMDLLGDGFR